jgi:hypothetical protein
MGEVTTLNGTPVTEQVRRALAEAKAAGRPAPGRPTLVKLTGATDHRIKQVLAELASETDARGGAGDGFPAPAPDHQPAASPGGVETASPAPARRTGGASARAARSPRNAGTASAARAAGGLASRAAGEHRGSVVPAGGALVGWVGFLFGAAVSVAANVLAARIPPEHAGPGWTPSVVAQLGAAVWPIALLLSVEALSRVRWPAGVLWRLARYGGAGTVAAGAAVISYGHIRAVLAQWGYSPLAAGVGPLVIDGLMTISGFALLASASATRAGLAGTSAGAGTERTPR